jgi:hypothetical protein
MSSGNKKEKPDNVSDNPGILPYGSNVGAPSIKPTDISGWKQEKLSKTNHYFQSRYDEIKEEYKKLIEAFEWSKLVYGSKFNFEPIKGETYYLYQRDSGGLFLSLIEPDYWNQIFVGAFRLDSDDKWTKSDYIYEKTDS